MNNQKYNKRIIRNHQVKNPDELTLEEKSKLIVLIGIFILCVGSAMLAGGF